MTLFCVDILVKIFRMSRFLASSWSSCCLLKLSCIFLCTAIYKVKSSPYIRCYQTVTGCFHAWLDSIIGREPQVPLKLEIWQIPYSFDTSSWKSQNYLHPSVQLLKVGCIHNPHKNFRVLQSKFFRERFPHHYPPQQRVHQAARLRFSSLRLCSTFHYLLSKNFYDRVPSF